jgi:ABC-type uncharacterized transport system substrate-binding protein
MGLPPVQALRQRTSTIPIVFSLVADPVGFGLVESLNHPGGNVTGFVVWDLSIGSKWMQLLQDIAPDLRRIGILIAQSARFKVPTLNPAFGAATRGALISYTYSFDLMMRQPVAYIDRILRGELAGSLPVQAPTKYVLSINLKVARTLGLSVPDKLLSLADEVIE